MVGPSLWAAGSAVDASRSEETYARVAPLSRWAERMTLRRRAVGDRCARGHRGCFDDGVDDRGWTTAWTTEIDEGGIFWETFLLGSQ